jgi:hypothetical protein
MGTLATSERYIDAGVTKIFYLPACANPSAPTRAEITAGTDLSDQIASAAGWQLQGAEVETPDLGSTFNSKIPGKTSVDDSSLTFYADLSGDDVRSVLPRGTTGFIFIADGGDVPGNKADNYPVRVRSVGKARTVEGTSAKVLTVSFSITSEPAEDVPVPAAGA